MSVFKISDTIVVKRKENEIIIVTDLVHRVYIVHSIYLSETKKKKKEIHGIIDNLLNLSWIRGET
jgi:hypothetical protein